MSFLSDWYYLNKSAELTNQIFILQPNISWSYWGNFYKVPITRISSESREFDTSVCRASMSIIFLKSILLHFNTSYKLLPDKYLRNTVLMLSLMSPRAFNGDSQIWRNLSGRPWSRLFQPCSTISKMAQKNRIVTILRVNTNSQMIVILKKKFYLISGQCSWTETKIWWPTPALL